MSALTINPVDRGGEAPVNRVRGAGHRLVPSQFPPIGVFDTVASPEDALAAMRLESLTNDRLQLPLRRAAMLPKEDWLLGQPGAQAVMAAFLHAAPEGGRFTGPALGAWYCARSLETAIEETMYHQNRRVVASAGLQQHATIAMREWTNSMDVRLIDLRGRQQIDADLYDANSYGKSQLFGERVRAAGGAGIVYDSVRHPGGTCVVLYRPRSVAPVKQGIHLEYRWTGGASPTVWKREQLR
ncbi:MAG: RES family NAD+ phosphorylase [Gemmatimonas sp.]